MIRDRVKKNANAFFSDLLTSVVSWLLAVVSLFLKLDGLFLYILVRVTLSKNFSSPFMGELARFNDAVNFTGGGLNSW